MQGAGMHTEDYAILPYSSTVGTRCDNTDQSCDLTKNAGVGEPLTHLSACNSFLHASSEFPGSCHPLLARANVAHPTRSKVRTADGGMVHTAITRLASIEASVELGALGSNCNNILEYAHLRKAFRATVYGVNEIVQEKLYKLRGMSLEEYFKTKFGISRAQVYRVVDSASVLRDLDSTGADIQSDNDMPPLPVKQRVCAAIKALTSVPYERKLVWVTACEKTRPDAITSKDIRQTWSQLVEQHRVANQPETALDDVSSAYASTTASPWNSYGIGNEVCMADQATRNGAIISCDSIDEHASKFFVEQCGCGAWACANNPGTAGPVGSEVTDHFTHYATSLPDENFALPARDTVDTLPQHHAELIEKTINALQTFVNYGITLEPCVGGLWFSGITKWRFNFGQGLAPNTLHAGDGITVGTLDVDHEM